MSYIQDLRTLVGHRRLIFVGPLIMIYDEHHQLLLQHRVDTEMWDLPGGYMELDESTEEAVRREVREETGLEVGKMSLVAIFSGKKFRYRCPNGDLVAPVSPIYVTNDAHGRLRPDGAEGLEVRYFPINALPAELSPRVRELVETFLKSRGM